MVWDLDLEGPLAIDCHIGLAAHNLKQERFQNHTTVITTEWAAAKRYTMPGLLRTRANTFSRAYQGKAWEGGLSVLMREPGTRRSQPGALKPN